MEGISLTSNMVILLFKKRREDWNVPNHFARTSNREKHGLGGETLATLVRHEFPGCPELREGGGAAFRVVFEEMFASVGHDTDEALCFLRQFPAAEPCVLPIP
jgi:hypothetical protein